MKRATVGSTSSSSWLPFGRKRKAYAKGAVGLKNEGNTCYFNSMLQILLNAGPFFKPLPPLLGSDETGDSLGECSTAFAALLSALHRFDTYSALSTRTLRRSLSTRDAMFTDGRQHDSWLALSHLLSQLEAEWLAANPSEHCAIGLRFERPFELPDSVSHLHLAKHKLDLLLAKKLLAKSTACFYGVGRDTVQCHGCRKTTTQYSTSRMLDFSWNTTGCIARVIDVRNGVVDGVIVCEVAKGLNEDSTVSNLHNVVLGTVLEEDEDYEKWQLLFFLVSFDSGLKVKPVTSKQRLGELSLENQCLVVIRNDEAHRCARGMTNARFVFSIVVGAGGGLQSMDGVRDSALIPDFELLGERNIHALCAEAIGLDESKIDIQSEAREWDLYVTCDGAMVYDWNKDELRASSLPLVLVLWPRAHGPASDGGRKWNVPYFCPESTTSFGSEVSAMSAAFAAAKRQCPELDVSKAINEWNKRMPFEIPDECRGLDISKYKGEKFWRNAAAAIVKKWELPSAAPLMESALTLPSSCRLTLGQCVENSERTVECSWRESRCRNPECDKRTLSFTRTTELVLPPHVLAVRLNRDTQGTGIKDNRPVDCPLSFEFKGSRYKMVGASLHDGHSLHYGHYTAKVRNAHSGDWFHADDGSISDISEPKMISNATLVVYVRVLVVEDADEYKVDGCDECKVDTTPCDKVDAGKTDVDSMDTDKDMAVDKDTAADKGMAVDIDMAADKSSSIAGDIVTGNGEVKVASAEDSTFTALLLETEPLSGTVDSSKLGDLLLDATDKSDSVVGSDSVKETAEVVAASDEVDDVNADSDSETVAKKPMEDAKEEDIVVEESCD